MDINNSSLHSFIINYIIDSGYPPKIVDISNRFGASTEKVITALQELQDYHGVVLHPKSNEVWVMHPFSTAPTNFWIQSRRGGWWGNCSWCSLGAAALLNDDVTITTTLGGEGKQVIIEIRDGNLQDDSLYVHFPVPMMEAWDNVTFTCSTMLIFESELEIDSWCERHGMKKGDFQSIRQVWEFSKVWYGRHLDTNWKKWTTDEAKSIFKQFGFVNDIWAMPEYDSRF